MTDEQLSRALRDRNEDVRWAVVMRPEIILSPDEIDYYSEDASDNVRKTVEARTTEWTARWEAQKLHKKHQAEESSMTGHKPTL